MINTVSFIDKLMIKSIGYKIIKYINKLLNVIGIDINNITYIILIIVMLLCTFILLYKLSILIYNLMYKNDKKIDIQGYNTIKTDLKTNKKYS